jgi:hypothetical protein
MCGRAADPKCVLDGALQIVMWRLSDGQHSVHYEQYSASTEMTIQYGFARGKMLVRRKGASPQSPPAPCLPRRPRALAELARGGHHLRRSPPSSSCNSLQERSPSLSIKPLCALPPHDTATIQFELLLSTTLFLSREGVRTSLLRQQKNVSSNLVRNISLSLQLTSECQSP